MVSDGFLAYVASYSDFASVLGLAIHRTVAKSIHWDILDTCVESCILAMPRVGGSLYCNHLCLVEGIGIGCH